MKILLSLLMFSLVILQSQTPTSSVPSDVATENCPKAVCRH